MTARRPGPWPVLASTGCRRLLAALTISRWGGTLGTQASYILGGVRLPLAGCIGLAGLRPVNGFRSRS